MKIEQLNYFLETARLEHLGKAGKSLAISPSAISHAIANLEEELGCSLFEKKGKRIFLTAEGVRFKGWASNFLNQIETIKAELTAEQTELEGNYRIAASHVLSSRMLAPVLGEFLADHDKVRVEVFSLRSAEVAKGVAEGAYDLGLCFSPQSHPNLDINEIYQGQLQIYCRKKHPILKRAKFNVSDLSDYRAILPKAFAGIEVCESHPMLNKYAIVARPQFAFDSYGVAVELISTTDCWGLLPDKIGSWYSQKLTELPPPKGWNAPYSISLITAKNRPISKAIRQLIEAFA